MVVNLIIISGQVGAGKTSVSKNLLLEIENTAYIESDSLIRVNPFTYEEKLINLTIKNAICLVNNFTSNGTQNIIISGLIKNQRELDKFVPKLDSTNTLLVWLYAGKDIRKNRKKNRNRDEADKIYNFDFVDKLIPDFRDFQLKNGKCIYIDTSDKTVEQVVKEVKNNFKF